MFGFNFFNYLLIMMHLNMVSWNARGLLNMEKFEKMEVLCKEADVIVYKKQIGKMKVLKGFKQNGMVIYCE